MSAKSTQKVTQSGYGTNNPRNSTPIVNQGKAGHKVPKLGSVGMVPDKNSPESCRGRA